MKYCFFLLFVTSQIFSHAQEQQEYFAKWECETSKEKLIEKKLYEKKYNGKMVQTKNTVRPNKSFYVYFENIDIDTNVNLHIEIDHTIKGEITKKKINSFYSNSIREVYKLLMDLREVIYKKADECYFKRYYFKIDYTDMKNKKIYRDLFWLEKEQLENFLNNRSKKKLFETLDIQYVE